MKSFRSLLCLAAVSGFIALSWEIVWARLYNFVTASRAPAFGAMLGSYLLGLALGSLWSMKWQKHERDASVRNLGRLILAANAVAFFVVPLASMAVTWLPDVWYGPAGITMQSWVVTLTLVMLASAVQGTILPLMCHVGIPADARAGQRLSFVYLANIVGSGAGSLLTGFVLMEHVTLAQLSAALLILAVISSQILAGGSARFRAGATVGALALGFLGMFGPLFGGLWERLYYKQAYAGQRFQTVVESRHGVITIDADKKVYGNGAYDGYIGTSLTFNDWHVRPYFLSAVHPNPRRILVVGMSAGPWTQILASHPQAEHVDVVEISEAYLKVVAHYPEVSSILKNPKVSIHIDDGRRWLKRHPAEKFDAVVMNTTHHWREFASSLLSREFLELAKSHLAEDGIVMWNCTDSGRAAKTGMDVFPHTMMCMNNCIGSLRPLVPDKARWRDVLSRYVIDGRPVFDVTQEAGRAELDKVVALCDNDRNPPPSDEADRWWIVSRARMEALWGAEKAITDDNLGHEYQ